MKSAFTLIELLIVIAILGILAAAVLVAINPGKRNAQARDALRKSHINGIANALVGYYAITGEYPKERVCDTSRGYSFGTSINCADVSIDFIETPEWSTTNSDKIYKKLVEEQGFLKKLPIDPKNDLTFYYRYEPRRDATSGNCNQSQAPLCSMYWIGTRLESVDDPSNEGMIVFRCTDNPALAAGTGCKTVKFGTATGGTSFDSTDPDDTALSSEVPFP